MNLGAAEQCYEAALAAAPESWASSAEGVEALCRLCKQLSDQGWCVAAGSAFMRAWQRR